MDNSLNIPIATEALIQSNEVLLKNFRELIVESVTNAIKVGNKSVFIVKIDGYTNSGVLNELVVIGYRVVEYDSKILISWR